MCLAWVTRTLSRTSRGDVPWRPVFRYHQAQTGERDLPTDWTEQEVTRVRRSRGTDGRRQGFLSAISHVPSQTTCLKFLNSDIRSGATHKTGFEGRCMPRSWPERALLQMLLPHRASLRPHSAMEAKLFWALSLSQHDWPPFRGSGVSSLGSRIIAHYPWQDAIETRQSLAPISRRLRRYGFLILSPTWSEAD